MLKTIIVGAGAIAYAHAEALNKPGVKIWIGILILVTYIPYISLALPHLLDYM